jgi:hypothetical protein
MSASSRFALYTILGGTKWSARPICWVCDPTAIREAPNPSYECIDALRRKPIFVALGFMNKFYQLSRYLWSFAPPIGELSAYQDAISSLGIAIEILNTCHTVWLAVERIFEVVPVV